MTERVKRLALTPSRVSSDAQEELRYEGQARRLRILHFERLERESKSAIPSTSGDRGGNGGGRESATGSGFNLLFLGASSKNQFGWELDTIW